MTAPAIIDQHRNTCETTTSDGVAITYQSEIEYIKRCIFEYPDIETGGQLFGYWTSFGSPVVLYVIGPGKNANHQTTFFQQDLDYLMEVGNHLVKNMKLQHIGEWHSHHRLGLAHPSGHDADTIINNQKKHHLPWFLLCIGNCNDREATVNPFIFNEGNSFYNNAQWQVVAIDSPFRDVIDKQLSDILIHPKNN